MLITFHSKVVAEVLMLAKHAGPLLQAAGKSFDEKSVPEQGVFTPSIARRHQESEARYRKKRWHRTGPAERTRTPCRCRPWRCRLALPSGHSPCWI